LAYIDKTNYIVSGGYDGKILMWDYKTGKLVKSLANESNKVIWVSSINKTNLIVSSNLDHKISLICSGNQKNIGCCGTITPYSDTEKNCYEACPNTMPYYDADKNCYVKCPENARFFTSNECLPICPPDKKFFDSVYRCSSVCPSNTPVYDDNNFCMKECPENYKENGSLCERESDVFVWIVVAFLILYFCLGVIMNYINENKFFDRFFQISQEAPNAQLTNRRDLIVREGLYID